MAIEQGSSLEILRGADPRLLDVVEHDLHEDKGFGRDLAHVNAPLSFRLMTKAKGYLQRGEAPDKAYTDGFEQGLAAAGRLAFADEVSQLETAVALPDAEYTQVKKHRLSRWLGMRTAKLALTTGVIASLPSRDGDV